MVDKKQIRSWIQKQKQLINETQEEKSRDYIVMMWLGYLNGLRLTNAITYQEYKELYDELNRYVAGAEVA